MVLLPFITPKRMRFSLLIMLIISTFHTKVTAQLLHPKPNFGVKGGLTSGKLIPSPVEDRILKFNTGFNLAGYYRYRTKKFAIQPEIGYSQRGGTFKQGVNITRNTYRYMVGAVVLGWMPTEGLTFEAGPEYLYALNTPESVRKGPEVRSDVGITAGFRYDFMDGLDNVSLGMRFSQGLNNVGTQALGIRTQAIQVSLMYNFYRDK